VENVGIYRLQVKERNRLGIQTVPQHDIAIHMDHAEERGEDLPVAIALKNELIICAVSATPLLYDQLEHKMTAVTRATQYRVVKGPNTCWRVACFADSARPRGPSKNSAVFIQDVTSIRRLRPIGYRTARTDLIYDAVYVGRPWAEMHRSRRKSLHVAQTRDPEVRTKLVENQLGQTRFRNNLGIEHSPSIRQHSCC
jgi:4-hydroxybenzoate decarboxylase